MAKDRLIGTAADRAQLQKREQELRQQGARAAAARRRAHDEAVARQDAAWRAQDPRNR